MINGCIDRKSNLLEVAQNVRKTLRSFRRGLSENEFANVWKSICTDRTCSNAPICMASVAWCLPCDTNHTFLGWSIEVFHNRSSLETHEDNPIPVRAGLGCSCTTRLATFPAPGCVFRLASCEVRLVLEIYLRFRCAKGNPRLDHTRKAAREIHSACPSRQVRNRRLFTRLWCATKQTEAFQSKRLTHSPCA